MEFETKVLSKSIFESLYETGKTLATAESCTSGRIAEAITSVPGASDYFKGGVVCYSNNVKEQLLGVDAQLIEEKTAVCEEVAIALVKGACKALGTDYAISATGYAGPAAGGVGDTTPVGTIWVACGSADDVRTFKLEEDRGREVNLVRATNKALSLFSDFIHEIYPVADVTEVPNVEIKGCED